MSGQHRVVRPRRPFWLTILHGPGRLVWIWVRSVRSAGAWLRRCTVERIRERFAEPDPFADMGFAPRETSPDPLPAATPAPAAEPAPLSLPPDQALQVLHGRHPYLPGSCVKWRLSARAVSGAVSSLDADEAGQRQIVGMYADVLAAPITEHVDGTHLTVSVAGEFAGCAVTVAAVLLHDDTMPLPVYRESASTLETQAIPDEVLREVMAA